MDKPPSSPNKNDKLPKPFSLRLTFDERAALEKDAGNKPLGVYIRAKLFEGEEQRTRTRKPVEDERALAVCSARLALPIILTNWPKPPIPVLCRLIWTRKMLFVMPVLLSRICEACSCEHWTSSNRGASHDPEGHPACWR